MTPHFLKAGFRKKIVICQLWHKWEETTVSFSPVEESMYAFPFLFWVWGEIPSEGATSQAKFWVCSFSLSQAVATWRPGSGTCGPGGNYVKKKTHAESGYIIISPTYGLLYRPFRALSPPGTLEVLPILQIHSKSPLVYTDVCASSVTSWAHSTLLLVANNLESSIITNANVPGYRVPMCTHSARVQDLASHLSVRTGVRYNFYVHVLEQDPRS